MALARHAVIIDLVGETDESPRARRTLRAYGWSFAVWTVVALLAGSVRYVYHAGKENLTWWHSVAYSLTDEYVWAALTPPLLGFGRRFRIDRARWRRNLPPHVLLALVVPVLYWLPAKGLTHLLGRAFGHPGWEWEATRVEFLGAYVNNLIVCGQVLAIGQGLLAYGELREREVRAAQLEARLTEATLQALRMQLHPHFLFNTLHAISALMRRDLEAADRMVALLGDLLRQSLRDGEAEVPLRREIEFLERYLEIEKVRFGDRLEVEIDVAPDCLEARVPGLLLHPLVENSLRHGLERTEEPGRLSIRARARDGRLHLRVADSGAGLRAGAPAEADGGIGLASTRARLEQLYGSEHAFEVRPREGGGVEATVVLPLRRGEVAPA
ncbi:MAG TPA: histidine kinase [Planctomycetota bacterium]|nr:histidine kinase [Planctomycetota bacterium]